MRKTIAIACSTLALAAMFTLTSCGKSEEKDFNKAVKELGQEIDKAAKELDKEVDKAAKELDKKADKAAKELEKAM